jgi:multimeric flavodoxin WrbA
MRILALGGSIRAFHPRSREILLELVEAANSLDDFILRANSLKLSNSELLSAAALLGAKKKGASVDYFSLIRMDSHDEIFNADGLLLASPVYFGDRSSVMDKFLQKARERRTLAGKPVAALSVGAKRNGGQETTNLYLLHEALNQGAFVVGNGPKNAQYGGTALGGDLGSVLSDQKGLATAIDTGERVSEVARLLGAPPGDREKLRILVLVTIETKENELEKRLQSLVTRASVERPHVCFEILALDGLDVERCIACSICPIPEQLISPNAYACIIQTPRDQLRRVRERLLQAHGILIAGVHAEESLLSHYQEFTERTRVMRRNDFELTNVPIASFTWEKVGASTENLFGLKVLTSYVRHNAILCPAVRELSHEGNTLVDGLPRLVSFVDSVDRITRRRAGARVRVSYKAEGYTDRRLDQTEALR